MRWPLWMTAIPWKNSPQAFRTQSVRISAEHAACVPGVKTSPYWLPSTTASSSLTAFETETCKRCCTTPRLHRLRSANAVRQPSAANFDCCAPMAWRRKCLGPIATTSPKRDAPSSSLSLPLPEPAFIKSTSYWRQLENRRGAQRNQDVVVQPFDRVLSWFLSVPASDQPARLCENIDHE